MRESPEEITLWHGRLRFTERQLRVAAFVSVIVISIIAGAFMFKLGGVKDAGYPAIFIISLLGNATLFLPVPAILMVCTGAVFLNPLLAGLVGGVGQALGETTGYLAGFSGSGLAQKSRYYGRIKPWMERHGWLVVLVFGLVPNPLFDVIGMMAGAMHMPFWKYLLVAAIGKTIRSIGIAFICAQWPDALRPLLTFL